MRRNDNENKPHMCAQDAVAAHLNRATLRFYTVQDLHVLAL